MCMRFVVHGVYDRKVRVDDQDRFLLFSHLLRSDGSTREMKLVQEQDKRRRTGDGRGGRVRRMAKV